MLPILQSVESISSCRDRARLPSILVGAVASLLGERTQVGVFSRDARRGMGVRVCNGTTTVSPNAAPWPEIIVDAAGSDGMVLRSDAGRHCGALRLQSSELCDEDLILAFGSDVPVSNDHSAGVEMLVRIFGNQIRMLDYSELDSLTRLLNRKTFDETFDRLLTAALAPRCECLPCNERRHDEVNDSPAWLCVVDIDHFKRINDSFGHLFGDEVLLRMGDLMRRTFRDGDRLFRFGGEEFVVILNADDVQLAAAGFERLRRSVEEHEFPQVGQVTCSIGFTAVSSLDVPTDALGRADEALYYAKEHGRNRVCGYESLLAEGEIVRTEPATAWGADDLDIDALFG